MAYTATEVKRNVMGNQRVFQYNVTADAASGVVVCPLSVVDCVAIAPISMATAAIKLKVNLNAASAAANGSIMVSSAVNGDNFFLTVYGR